MDSLHFLFCFHRLSPQQWFSGLVWSDYTHDYLKFISHWIILYCRKSSDHIWSRKRNAIIFITSQSQITFFQIKKSDLGMQLASVSIKWCQTQSIAHSIPNVCPNFCGVSCQIWLIVYLLGIFLILLQHLLMISPVSYLLKLNDMYFSS